MGLSLFIFFLKHTDSVGCSLAQKVMCLCITNSAVPIASPYGYEISLNRKHLLEVQNQKEFLKRGWGGVGGLLRGQVCCGLLLDSRFEVF